MLECRLRGIGLIGPGLPDWERARSVLRGESTWSPGAPEYPRPESLPASQYRRVTRLGRLVLATAQQALDSARIDPAGTTSVFASAGGDLAVAQELCQALAMPARPVSPTLFNNSVHNAPAGYFSIASGSRCASSSIAAGEDTAAAGLLEATSIACSERQPSLLVVYDSAPAEPLASCAGVPAGTLAVSMLIGPAATGGRRMRLGIDGSSGANSRPADPLSERLAGNPAAALLPLLSVAAHEPAGSVALPRHAGMALRVTLGHA